MAQVQCKTRGTAPVHLAPTPVRLVPSVHIGWDSWPERITCIATHTSATDDAWAHAGEKVPLGVTGAIASWALLGDPLIPWEAMMLSNHTVDSPHRRTEKPLMLALMALEATSRALQYDGPSTIYVADMEIAERQKGIPHGPQADQVQAP